MEKTERDFHPKWQAPGANAPAAAQPRKEKRASPKSATGGKTSDKPRVKAGIASLGIELNSTTARQAIILSEIIGKPLSKRGRRR